MEVHTGVPRYHAVPCCSNPRKYAVAVDNAIPNMQCKDLKTVCHVRVRGLAIHNHGDDVDPTQKQCLRLNRLSALKHTLARLVTFLVAL